MLIRNLVHSFWYTTEETVDSVNSVNVRHLTIHVVRALFSTTSKKMLCYTRAINCVNVNDNMAA